MKYKTFGAMVIFCSSTAFGQVIFENHYATDIPQFMTNSGFDWLDLPGSEKAVTIPAGNVIFVWDMPRGNVGGNVVFFRPRIGVLTPFDGIKFGEGGSWTTHTNGGDMTVALQVMSPDSFQLFANGAGTGGGMSWSLIIAPDVGAAPAVGIWGIGIMTLLLVGVGVIVFKTSLLGTES